LTSAAATYASLAPFAGTFGQGLPALLYHKIGGFKTGVRRRGLYVSARSFRAQLRELRRAGFRSTTPGDTSPQSESADHQRIAITFDDGFTSTLEQGVPLLHEAGWRAVNFFVSGRLGGVNTWDLADGERPEPLMDEAQVRDWLAAGHDLGAHTITHAHLTQLPRAAAREEISGSRKALEDRFSRAVTDFAYPYGEFVCADRVLVGEAGFLRAWTVEPAVITRDSDPLALPRFPVSVSLRHPLHLLRSLIPLWQ
jgi:peptidoglycan/xylan/chitin deacetylase (PgdA/CDA1 family)